MTKRKPEASAPNRALGTRRRSGAQKQGGDS